MTYNLFEANGPMFLVKMWFLETNGPKKWFLGANGVRFPKETWFFKYHKNDKILQFFLVF
jgi:hypothetical protein